MPRDAQFSQRDAALQARTPVVAVVGATGAVGIELIACLEGRGFPLARLRLFASPRSAGRTLAFRGVDLPVEVLDADWPVRGKALLFEKRSKNFLTVRCAVGDGGV